MTTPPTPPTGPSDPTPVAVLGLGAMGAALARALLAAGHPTTVWNRSPGRTGDLAAAGATVAAAAGDAAAAGELVIVCVVDQAASTAVVEAAGPALAGRTLVDLTNGTPADGRANAERAAGYGAAHLDGGIMAIPPQIATPSATVLYSGDEQAYARHAGTLGVLGTPRWLGTDPGAAALLDLALLTAMYGMIGGFAHAVAMLGDDRPARDFAPDAVAWLTAMLPSLTAMAAQVDAGDYTTDVSTLEINDAGFANLLATSEERGVDPALLRPLAALVSRGVAEGHGRDGLARLVPLLRSR